MLSHPDYTQEFNLHTDASDTGISGVLKQRNKIIGIYSKKLNEIEARYTTTEKELYAIIKSLIHFKRIYYLQESIYKQTVGM